MLLTTLFPLSFCPFHREFSFPRVCFSFAIRPRLRRPTPGAAVTVTRLFIPSSLCFNLFPLPCDHLPPSPSVSSSSISRLLPPINPQIIRAEFDPWDIVHRHRPSFSLSSPLVLSSYQIYVVIISCFDCPATGSSLFFVDDPHDFFPLSPLPPPLSRFFSRTITRLSR